MMQFQFYHPRRDGGFCLQLEGSLPLGRTTALYGPSGAGKTTLLRLFAGLEQPQAGTLRFGATQWFGGPRPTPVQQRRIGMVFQDYALFPHLTVRDNIAFGAGRHGRALVDELLQRCALDSLATERPAALSGGQRQRVALARALASTPQLLLLDEPLSALDQSLRLELRQLLRDMQARFGLTMVLVSHDLAEVFSLADHVLHLAQGKLLAAGTPNELFLRSEHDRSRCQLHGNLLAIQPADVLWCLSVQIGNQTLDILCSAQEAQGLQIGQRINLSAGAVSLAPQQMAVSQR